jgi:2-polyprenyl-3-methyl-5-hydroxy-6-metoxy-1,4-benzoquinol methylase
VTELQEYWDREAETFDQEADHGLVDAVVRRAWEALLESVLPPECRRGLDLGCGTGTLTVLLAEMGVAMTGIDLAPRMIEHARIKAQQASVTAAFHCGDAGSPTVVGPFDLLVCRHVLWALPQQDAALRNWRTLVSSGGTLLAIEGAWSTGAGLTGAEAVELIGRHFTVSEIRPLPDSTLWGKQITDERYLIAAHA